VFRPPKANFKPDPRDSESPFGVLDFLVWDHPWNHHHYPLAKIKEALALMARAGIGWVRMDFLWADLEPKLGQFDFARYDDIVGLIRDQGIRILGILQYNPLWRGVPWNSAPDPEAYLRFAQYTVSHFRDRVRYWEIWNEPDVKVFWTPQDGLAAFCHLLRRVTPALKEVDPTCRVLPGGLSSEIPKWLRVLYEKAGRESFDVVNLHPFRTPLDRSALKALDQLHRDVRAIMR
jgi:polysaccharide biosynthesis protein PslG